MRIRIQELSSDVDLFGKKKKYVFHFWCIFYIVRNCPPFGKMAGYFGLAEFFIKAYFNTNKLKWLKKNYTKFKLNISQQIMNKGKWKFRWVAFNNFWDRAETKAASDTDFAGYPVGRKNWYIFLFLFPSPFLIPSTHLQLTLFYPFFPFSFSFLSQFLTLYLYPFLSPPCYFPLFALFTLSILFLIPFSFIFPVPPLHFLVPSPLPFQPPLPFFLPFPLLPLRLFPHSFFLLQYR